MRRHTHIQHSEQTEYLELHMNAPFVDMAFEREEAKHADASPSHIMTKFDSILFDSDEGPASSLFMEGGMNSSLTSEASDPMMIRTHGFEKAVGSSPCAAIKIESKTLVREEEEDTSKTFLLDKLREQLHKAQAELATERSNRKRKEKSLIKLAKELNNRSEIEASKEKAILEMAETIEDLEMRLADRNRDFVVDFPKLKARCAKQEAEIDDHEKRTRQLRQQLEEARVEADKAKGALIALLSKQVSSKKDIFVPLGETEQKGVVVSSKTRSSGAHGANIVITFIALLALALGVAVQNEFVSMDDVCAPVQPGSKFLSTDKAVFEAPWWAPKAVKEQAFVTFCGDRLWTRLHVDNGNVDIFGASGKSLWHGRALGGLTVDSNKITIRHKRGSVEEIRAPWSA